VERAPPPAAFDVDLDVARVERTLLSVAVDVDFDLDYGYDPDDSGRSAQNAPPNFSREAAAECSPRRKPWVSRREMNRVPPGTTETVRNGVLADLNAHCDKRSLLENRKSSPAHPKRIVTIRLDADLLRWFRQHPGYQTRINAILRAYTQAQA
jgi:uncharacterized protein (DUF4415 family)